MWSESCSVLWPASPSPASSAASLAAPPVPRPLAASRSSAHPAARSAYSSWGCPSSDRQCVPSDAEERSYSHSIMSFPSCLHKITLQQWCFDQTALYADMLVLTCQCSSRSLTCCRSSFRPVRASASLSFTPISSSWRRATFVSSGSDEFLWGRCVKMSYFRLPPYGVQWQWGSRSNKV